MYVSMIGSYMHCLEHVLYSRFYKARKQMSFILILQLRFCRLTYRNMSSCLCILCVGEFSLPLYLLYNKS